MTEFEIKAKEMCESIIKHFETDTIYITDPFEYCYNLAKATMKVSPFEAPVSPKTADTKEIDVWRIEAKDSGSAYYEHDISIVEDMLKSCDYESGYIITKHKMDKAKYEALPEFTGF